VKGFRPQKQAPAVPRYETKPGEYAQVDWGRVSGRMILKAIIQGIDDPDYLSQMAKGSYEDETGRTEKGSPWLCGSSSKMMLEAQLRHIEYLDQEIERFTEDIARRMHPFEKDLQLLDSIQVLGGVQRQKYSLK
jgi:hypothetical protein